MPQFSIIVPVFNAGQCLRGCIEHVLAQTIANFELILVDDGSSDGSPVLCDEYAARDHRVRVFHKPNGGASDARNHGIEQATAPWVTFCDADDEVLPCWLENFTKRISPVVDFVNQGFYVDSQMWTSDNPEFISKRRFGFNYLGDIPHGLELLDKNNTLGFVWCKCYRRDLLMCHHVRFDVKFNYQEDIVFNLDYLRFCRQMVSTSETGYHYNVPIWHNKYMQRRHMFELFGTQLCYTLDIFSGKKNDMSDWFCDMYVTALFHAFLNKEEGRVRKVRELRKNAGSYILCTNLFAPTRYALYLDPTGVFSSLFVALHCKIKAREERIKELI